MASQEIEALVQQLARLPGLGPRSARRAVLHLMKKRESSFAPLLAALLLARVDGKSPVEYLNASERAFVRRFARDFLHLPAENGDDIDALKHMWFERLDSR